jgi:hypothetical protein
MPRLLLAVPVVLVIAATAIGQDSPPAAVPVGPPVVALNEAAAGDSWSFWARAEYLLWFIRGDRGPVPLATTGTVGSAHSGALGDPGTATLIGPDLNYKPNSGGKLWLGAWIDPDMSIGVEAAGFCLETHSMHKKAYSDRTDGAPVIARPFYNLLTGEQDAQIITTPADALGGRYIGGISLFGDSRTWGGEANMLFNLAALPTWRWDLVGGFRYLGQKDEFRSDQSSTVLKAGTVGFGGVPAPAPDIVSLRDFLQTTNNFYGAQLGIQGRLQSGPWNMDLGVRAGLGLNQEHLEATGRTLLTDPAGKTQYLFGGLFVPPNLSRRDRSPVGYMSEVNVRIGYRITERWLASIGYTFLYWGNIIRPEGQINPVIDPRNVPSSLSYNPAAPVPPSALQATNYWAQGLTFGLEYRY